MFTGIITDIGTLKSCEGEGGKRLVIGTAYDTATIAIGASIACNGICLTVTQKGEGWFTADASPTTLAVTTMGSWQPGERINLERALKMGDELGGHIVTGHVDGVAEIIECSPASSSFQRKLESGEAEVPAFAGTTEARNYILSCPPDLACFIAAKGSVTLDGVSLTVTRAEENRFGVTLIPHTLEHTSWSGKHIGSKVNLEVDVLARYVVRNLQPETPCP